jgi:hypothetical protein
MTHPARLLSTLFNLSEISWMESTTHQAIKGCWRITASCRSEKDKFRELKKSLGVNARNRNTMVDCFTAAVKRGYAIATVCYGEVFPYNQEGFRKSIFSLFYDDLRPASEVSLTEIKSGHRRHIGAIGAWAWGYSRIADALEKLPL